MRMKIIHVSDHMTRNGGAETVPMGLMQAQKRAGDQIIWGRIHSCEVHRMHEQHPEAIWHLHNIVSFCGLEMIRYFKLNRIPYVMTLHDHWATGCPIRTLPWDEDAGRADCFCGSRRQDWVDWCKESYTVAVSHDQIERTERIAGYKPNAMIYHGIDTAVFSPGGETAEEPLVVTGHARKGDRGKGAWLVQEACKELGIRVHCIEGGLDPVTLRNLYRSAWVCAFPSIVCETFGLMAVEAMACGRPVLVTDFGGYLETVDNGYHSGLRVTASYEAIRDGLREMLAFRKEHLDEMGEHAAAQVRKRFALSRMADNYREIYRSAEDFAGRSPGRV